MGAKQPQPKICEHNGLVHDALIYGGVDELTAEVLAFVEQGADAGEAALIALPGRRARTVRTALQAQGAQATVVDMAQLGRNPGRIMPFVRQFVSDNDGRVRIRRRADLGGPHARGDRRGGPPRSAANLAFEGTGVPILCPYDSDALEDHVLEDAERTHPTILERGLRRESRCYKGWEDGLAAGSRQLPDFGKPQGELEFERGDLSLVRSVVRRQTERTTLSPTRAHGLLLAANEAASNSIAHAKPSGGRLRVWQIGEGVVVRGLRRRPDRRSVSRTCAAGGRRRGRPWDVADEPDVRPHRDARGRARHDHEAPRRRDPRRRGTGGLTYRLQTCGSS